MVLSSVCASLSLELSFQPFLQAFQWQYLKQTIAITTMAITKTRPAVADPTIRGSSWKLLLLEPERNRDGVNVSVAKGGQQVQGKDGRTHRYRWKIHTVFHGPKLHGEAVLTIASHCACPNLHHVGSIRLQPFQTHHVLLAGDCVGNAITLSLLWRKNEMV